MNNWKSERNYICNEDSGAVVVRQDYDEPLRKEIRGSSCATSTQKLIEAMIHSCDFPGLRRAVGKLYLFGAAYCDPDDQYDETEGKDIAELKLDEKYHTLMKKRYSYIHKILARAIIDVICIQMRHEKKLRNIHEELRKKGARR